MKNFEYPSGTSIVEYSDGSKAYRKNGKLHREGDLPAIDCFDGFKEYRINGKLHREGNLPARIYSDGYTEYWIEGKWQYPPDYKRK